MDEQKNPDNVGDLHWYIEPTNIYPSGAVDPIMLSESLDGFHCSDNTTTSPVDCPDSLHNTEGLSVPYAHSHIKTIHICNLQSRKKIES